MLDEKVPLGIPELFSDPFADLESVGEVTTVLWLVLCNRITRDFVGEGGVIGAEAVVLVEGDAILLPEHISLAQFIIEVSDLTQ